MPAGDRFTSSMRGCPYSTVLRSIAKGPRSSHRALNSVIVYSTVLGPTATNFCVCCCIVTASTSTIAHNHSVERYGSLIDSVFYRNPPHVGYRSPCTSRWKSASRANLSPSPPPRRGLPAQVSGGKVLTKIVVFAISTSIPSGMVRF